MTQATVQESHEFTPHSVPPGASGHERSAQENLESFASGFFEGAGPALTTVLNRKVTVSVVEVVQAKPAELLARMPLPWVVVEATYQRGMSGEARDRRRRASVLGVEGTGWDVGHAVRFLLSDHARYITGQTLVVDGGATLSGPERASTRAASSSR